jgi:hypothetical protein
MPFINSLPTLGDLLKFEAPQFYSRSAITLAAGQNLAMGTVLGRKTADDKHQAFDPVATDGTDTPVGILLGDIDATLIDREDALLLARHAMVAEKLVIWPTSIDADIKKAAVRHLEDIGILIRTSA